MMAISSLIRWILCIRTSDLSSFDAIPMTHFEVVKASDDTGESLEWECG